MKKKLFFLSVFLTLFINCYSQFSKTHYIPPLSGSSNISVTPEEQYLYISTPSVTPVNFKIMQLGGSTITGTVSRDTPYEYYIGYGNNTQLHVDAGKTSKILKNKGYIVEAEDLVYVAARVTAGNGNQAGEFVSKGIAALGTRFRIGAFTNTMVPSYLDFYTTFISVLATENNTTINFTDIKPNVTIINNPTVGNTPPSIVLNSGESYVIAVQGPNDANRDGLIGSLVTSDKPIVLNCGSFGGTDGEMGNVDLGFDQIVSAERTGKEYIFIKSTGMDNVEKILLVADEDDTEIYLNGDTFPSYTINAGQYIDIDGSNYNTKNGNLYIRTNKNVFAYQGIGDDGLPTQANQELFFVPPLSCQTPHVIDNIPFIDQIGDREFIGRVTIVTKLGASLKFIINGADYTLNSLPPGISVIGPKNVVGKLDYETYTIIGLTGNISVYSTGELYLAAYGSNGNATFGKFFSGFTFKPEISFGKLDVTKSGCIPNTKLAVNSLSPFDTFQWYFNDAPIPGATSSSYTPLNPGYYYLSATISNCGTQIVSDKIPVSSCPMDYDNDGVNNSIDLDNDNDGITNCTESFGNQYFNLTNTGTGTITASNYTNNYTGATTFAGSPPPSPNPIRGTADGNFTIETAQGKNNSVTYTVSNFTKPISMSLEYASAASDLLTSATEIRLTCPVNKTLTILNPNNQLLIDTNYDGIFESGITEYSSFEIRFRLNSNVPLAAGSGTFAIKGDLINSLSITDINLSDTKTSRVPLKLIATCIPKDTDNDGIADQIDLDSDNDTLPDFYEAQGQNIITYSHVDANNDGIDDAFGNGITLADSDNDGIANLFDLDSDNDGIYDLNESGSKATDINSDGIVDGTDFGSNGLSNSVETTADSGILNYNIADTDADKIYNYIELDSDNDLCNDVVEAGYLDSNNDGLLGGLIPPTVNAKGIVTSGTGYTSPNNNYIISAPITISAQPQNATICELQSATFSVTSNAITSYQWEVSADNGASWNTVINNATYTGANTASLTVFNASPTISGYQYRVFLNRTGNSCGLHSSAANLTTYALPAVLTPVSLVQCDDDTDGISTFNLTQKNDMISANHINETFTYYTTLTAANAKNDTFLIANPIAFPSGNTTIYARVENSNGCFSVAQINLMVSSTQLPSSFQIPNQYKCDDYVDIDNDDRDGISSFDLSGITADLLAVLPPPNSNYSINYYRTEADFLAETDASGNTLAIQNLSNYRNTGYPHQQTIWVRVDSVLDNSCYGYKTFTLNVEALPFANPVNVNNIIRHCDDNRNGVYGFDTSGIQAAVLKGQTNVNVSYFKADGTQLSTPLPNPLSVNGTETIKIRVTNNSTMTGGEPCFDEESLQFIVDNLPQAFAIAPSLTTECDDELNPIDQDGKYDFDTSTFQNTILGNQVGMTVYYFDQNNNSLSSPLPNPYTSGTQNAKVVIENPINTSCKTQSTIPFVVHPTPKIDLEENVIICLPNTQVTLNAGLLDGTPASKYKFKWYKNNTPISGATKPSLTVSSPGSYSVDVTNTFNCTKTRTVTVTGSEIASVQSIDVTDLTDLNSILVTVTGTGDYEYALDDANALYQDNNLFNDVTMGFHELFIRDKNGCGLLGPISVPVLGIPKYFTPNGDGYNDYWNVKGLATSNKQSLVYIFDRFGKLLKQIDITSSGWDGIYDGKEMPADDYWYTIQFGDGRSAKGHFALTR